MTSVDKGVFGHDGSGAHDQSGGHGADWRYELGDDDALLALAADRELYRIKNEAQATAADPFDTPKPVDENVRDPKRLDQIRHEKSLPRKGEGRAACGAATRLNPGYAHHAVSDGYGSVSGSGGSARHIDFPPRLYTIAFLALGSWAVVLFIAAVIVRLFS